MSSIVVVSDLHCGCRLGLCPSSGAAMDDGGWYHPTDFQRRVWEWWEAFWYTHVPDMTAHEPYAVVVNGELIDGVHHGVVTQWSQNLADQARCAIEVLRPIAQLCEGRIYVTRGTEAHSGKSSQYDEWIAREIGAVPSKDGQFARNELWKRLGGPDGALVHIMHHCRTAGSSADESAGIYRELIEAYVEAARWGDRPPDAIVRSHVHLHHQRPVATGRGECVAVITPGWQGKTPFAFRSAGTRQRQPQFGGVVIRWTRHHGISERHQVWRLERPEPE